MYSHRDSRPAFSSGLDPPYSPYILDEAKRRNAKLIQGQRRQAVYPPSPTKSAASKNRDQRPRKRRSKLWFWIWVALAIWLLQCFEVDFVETAAAIVGTGAYCVTLGYQYALHAYANNDIDDLRAALTKENLCNAPFVADVIDCGPRFSTKSRGIRLQIVSQSLISDAMGAASSNPEDIFVAGEVVELLKNTVSTLSSSNPEQKRKLIDLDNQLSNLHLNSKTYNLVLVKLLEKTVKYSKDLTKKLEESKKTKEEKRLGTFPNEFDLRMISDALDLWEDQLGTLQATAPQMTQEWRRVGKALLDLSETTPLKLSKLDTLLGFWSQHTRGVVPKPATSDSTTKTSIDTMGTVFKRAEHNVNTALNGIINAREDLSDGGNGQGKNLIKRKRNDVVEQVRKCGEAAEAALEEIKEVEKVRKETDKNWPQKIFAKVIG